MFTSVPKETDPLIFREQTEEQHDAKIESTSVFSKASFVGVRLALLVGVVLLVFTASSGGSNNLRSSEAANYQDRPAPEVDQFSSFDPRLFQNNGVDPKDGKEKENSLFIREPCDPRAGDPRCDPKAPPVPCDPRAPLQPGERKCVPATAPKSGPSKDTGYVNVCDLNTDKQAPGAKCDPKEKPEPCHPKDKPLPGRKCVPVDSLKSDCDPSKVRPGMPRCDPREQQQDDKRDAPPEGAQATGGQGGNPKTGLDGKPIAGRMQSSLYSDRDAPEVDQTASMDPRLFLQANKPVAKGCDPKRDPKCKDEPDERNKNEPKTDPKSKDLPGSIKIVDIYEPCDPKAKTPPSAPKCDPDAELEFCNPKDKPRPTERRRCVPAAVKYVVPPCDPREDPKCSKNAKPEPCDPDAKEKPASGPAANRKCVPELIELLDAKDKPLSAKEQPKPQH